MEPYFWNGSIVLYHADCLKVMRTWVPESVDSVVTDPPYNIGFHYASYADNLPEEEYFDWLLGVLRECGRVLKPGGSVLCLNYPESAARIFCGDHGLDRFRLLTWIYHQHTGGKPLRRGTRQWCWLTKGEPYINDEALRGEYKNPTDRRVRRLIAAGRRPTDYDWWHYEQVKNVSPEKVAHPCQLPLAMTRRVVSMVTPPGGIVVDPFCGSGTTMVSALQLGLGAVGMDTEESYLRLAVGRLL